MLRVRDQGFTVHETESSTLIGTLLEHVLTTTPFEMVALPLYREGYARGS